jgi:putative membrane protein
MAHAHHAASGHYEFLVSLSIIAIVLVYLRGWVRLRSKPGSTPTNAGAAWRAWSFLVGMFFIWIAIASPVALLDEQLLTVHMVQHLLLMTLAPPLIWLATPVAPLTHGLPRHFVQIVLRPMFEWPPVQELGKALANPVFCWLAASAALLGWHIPPAFALGVQSGAWHIIEHASFLAAGLLFWWPVIQPWPQASQGQSLSIILYLFLATLPCDILSGFLIFCDRVVYPAYISSSHLFGLSTLGDQECAGALMWTCVTLVYFVAAAILTTRLLSPEGFCVPALVHPELSASGVPQKVPQPAPHTLEAF